MQKARVWLEFDRAKEVEKKSKQYLNKMLISRMYCSKRPFPRLQNEAKAN